MKPEPFGWFAPRAPKIAEPAKVATGLEFLVKADADDSSALEPEPTAETYRQGDGSGLKKLFAIEDAPERRSDVSLAYEDVTKAVFGTADPRIMDSRTDQPVVAPPKHSVTSLEKRDKKDIFNGSTVEFHGRDKWTQFYRDGELVRMRLESGDFSEPLEFDAQGNLAA